MTAAATGTAAGAASPPAGSDGAGGGVSDVPARLLALRAATSVALAAEAARRAAREADEAAVDDDAAAQLRAQRDALRLEARARNARLKRLIDRLRTLYRDLGVICDAPGAEPRATAAVVPAGDAPTVDVVMDAMPPTAPVPVASVE